MADGSPARKMSMRELANMSRSLSSLMGERVNRARRASDETAPEREPSRQSRAEFGV